MLEVHVAFGISLVIAALGGLWVARALNEAPPAPETPAELVEAMREVDALTPACPPIAPTFRGRVDLSRLVPPDAPAAEVWPGRPGLVRPPAPAPLSPKCDGPGGCGHYHRKGITCGQALVERMGAEPW